VKSASKVRARQLAGGLLIRYLANSISRMMTLIGTPNSHKMIGISRSLLQVSN
jgi:hypothetical protein